MPRLPLDDASAPLFTVGQVADMLDVQIAFLRRLDEHEVVRPARSGGGQRRYSRYQIERVSEVLLLVDEGLTLAAVRRVFELQARVAELEGELAKARAYVAQLIRERAGKASEPPLSPQNG